MFDSIASIQNAMEQNRTSAAALCDAMIERIIYLDEDINAYSGLLFDTARREALASDHRRARGELIGLLDGIPIAIKDLIGTTPSTTDSGLGPFMSRTSVEDAIVISRLRKAGAVILGVTQTDTGGFGTITPQTVNPLAPDLIAGGSSGGSAAAVASGMAFGALGTDTGGSVRIPSACCSIVGFKPSWGRVPAAGVWPLAPSFDHVGTFARSIGDLLILQQVIDTALSPQLPIGERAPHRVGFVKDWQSAPPSPSSVAFESIEKLVRDRGIACTPVILPDQSNFLDAHVENALREAFDYYEALAVNWKSFPETARDSIAIGCAVTDRLREQNSQQRALVVKQVERLFDDVDVVMLPALPMEVPAVGVSSVSLRGVEVPILQATIFFTALFNFTGHPVVSMPAFLLPDGRALNIQLVGKKNGDAELLAVALWLEKLWAVHVDYSNLVNRNRKRKYQEQPE